MKKCSPKINSSFDRGLVKGQPPLNLTSFHIPHRYDVFICMRLSQSYNRPYGRSPVRAPQLLNNFLIAAAPQSTQSSSRSRTGHPRVPYGLRACFLRATCDSMIVERPQQKMCIHIFSYGACTGSLRAETRTRAVRVTCGSRTISSKFARRQPVEHVRPVVRLALYMKKCSFEMKFVF